jgi:hypothetical protein
MKKLSLETLNKIEEAKGQAKYTGYFWILIFIFHIFYLSGKNNLIYFNNEIFFHFFIIFVEFIFIYLSLFKFNRFINIISPVIFLSIIIFLYFLIQQPINNYSSFYLNLVKKTFYEEGNALMKSNSVKIIIFLIPILPFYFFYTGIKGSFAYHKLMKENNL